MPLKKIFYKKLFLQAQIDEVDLDLRARDILQKLDILTLDAFKQLQVDKGLDLATRVLYLYLMEKQQRWFVNSLENIPATPVSYQNNIKIIIVPGMHYREHSEVDGDGKLAVDIATKLGLDVELIETNSRGSVKQNVALIQRVLEKNHEKDIWLLSLSKGSLEIRHYLEQTKVLPSNIRGWLSIGGVCFGSKLADLLVRNRARRLLTRLLCKLMGVDYKILSELATSTDKSEKKFVVPDQMTMIHVVAMPLKSHVSRLLQPRYTQLSEYGANDGVVLLSDYLQLPGFIYPIWGVDHLMRSPGTSALIYRLFYFIQNHAGNC